MMSFLVQYVLIDLVNLGMSIGKRSMSLLPGKFPAEEFLLINKFARIVLHISYQIRNRQGWLQTYKQMHVVFNTIYNNGLLTLTLNDTGHVFENFLPPWF